MTDVQIKHHGLEAFLRRLPEGRITTAEIEVEIISGASHFNLRGNESDSAFSSSIEEALQLTLPTANMVDSNGHHRIYWLGPDEWLIVTPEGMTVPQSAQLATISHNHGAALNDLSGGQILLRLTGNQVERLLAKGCPLDLHESVFPVGICAQSGLAKANVLLARVDTSGSFEIIVRRSFSDYVLSWLAHSGKTIGIKFSAR
jgi:sarcosine oxidase subunit gamma